MAQRLAEWQKAFLKRHALPASYLQHALKWFAPLAGLLAAQQKSAGRPQLIAVNGSQGSGKTTVCDYLRAVLQQDFQCRVVSLSLDDFYFSHSQRELLARTVHPLLATRGVPGTHDMDLLNTTLDALLVPGLDAQVNIPRFDKSVDDRRPQYQWDRVTDRTDLVLLEGWCLGARPQKAQLLAQSVNSLERHEDPDGRWRNYVNEILAQQFEPLYQRVDQWVMLRAPNFECVYRWRLEQERKLIVSKSDTAAGRIMNQTQLARFIQFYERLTRHCLATLPQHVDHLFSLDEQRRISGYRAPQVSFHQ